MRPLSLGLLVLPLFWASTVLAQSDTPDAELASIRESVLHATYRPAAAAIAAYLARGDLDAAHRNAGLEVDAIVRLALRDDAGASAALVALFARDPGHRLADPDASPVVQSAFARARDSADARSIELASDTPALLDTHTAPVLSIRLGEGADAVQEVRISYRHSGETRWATLVATPEGGVASATVPLTEVGGEQTVEYHVEALAPSSTVIGTLGSEGEPLSVRVPAPTFSASGDIARGGGAGANSAAGGGSVADEAWFWILIGVVVVGAGVGIGVGVAVSQPGPQDGSLGNVTLPLVSF